MWIISTRCRQFITTSFGQKKDGKRELYSETSVVFTLIENTVYRYVSYQKFLSKSSISSLIMSSLPQSCACLSVRETVLARLDYALSNQWKLDKAFYPFPDRCATKTVYSHLATRTKKIMLRCTNSPPIPKKDDIYLMAVNNLFNSCNWKVILGYRGTQCQCRS